MRFTKVCDQIAPVDQAAIEWYAGLKEGQQFTLSVVEEKQTRTHLQNKAMWKYCAMLAHALNDAGFDMRKFPYREGLEIPWSRHSIMETFWRPVQQALTGEKSTTKQITTDPSAVYEVVDRAISERTGVTVPFPSRHSMSED